MKLKKLLLLTCCILFLQNVSAQRSANSSTPLPASEILEAAIKKAGAEKKQVLAIFHASWCGWCHKMMASLADPEIKPYFDENYVIAEFVVYESKDKTNLENPGAADLLKKYNNADQGLPTWLFFDAKQNLTADSQVRPAGAAQDSKGENVGCPAKPDEVAYFIACLKKTSKLNQAQLDKIAAVFSKNEVKRL